MPTTDPRGAHDGPAFLRALALPLLRDPRDLIFVRMMLLVSVVVLPLAGGIFLLPPWAVALVAVPYLGFVFLSFGGRYGLMLHANRHRPIFKREYRWLSHYVPFVLGPFLGHTPTSFAAHHMWMHHAENNMLGDGSCTLPYRRDHFPHFLHYWFRFFAFGHMHLIRYLVLRGRHKTALRFVLGELLWFSLVGVALWVNWAAALLVFVVPMLMMRWLMMAGNWAQHAFVDLRQADSGWGNSTCLTNTRYNHKCYNDGYHIVHHLKPSLHWSEMAQWYDDHIDQFR
jgi:fatty acid desaturase